MVQEKRKRDIDLGKDPVGRLVVRLAVPAVLAQLINLLYNLVDRMYVEVFRRSVHRLWQAWG